MPGLSPCNAVSAWEPLLIVARGCTCFLCMRVLFYESGLPALALRGLCWASAEKFFGEISSFSSSAFPAAKIRSDFSFMGTFNPAQLMENKMSKEVPLTKTLDVIPLTLKPSSFPQHVVEMWRLRVDEYLVSPSDAVEGDLIGVDIANMLVSPLGYPASEVHAL